MTTPGKESIARTWVMDNFPDNPTKGALALAFAAGYGRGMRDAGEIIMEAAIEATRKREREQK
jgi:hypothetical protein